MYAAVLLAVGLSIVAGQGLNQQLDNAGQQIMDITARVVNIQNDLDARLATFSDGNGKVSLLANRLNNQYGTGCKKGQFRCGTTVKCISNILVCDGSSDCPNGEDETDLQCSYTLPVGSKWVGYKLWDKCVASGYTNQAEEYWIVTDVKRVDYFTPTVTVTWQWYTNRETKDGTIVTNVPGVNTFTFYDRVMTGVVNGNTMQNGCYADPVNPKFIRCWAYRLGEIGVDCAPSVWYRAD